MTPIQLLAGPERGEAVEQIPPSFLESRGRRDPAPVTVAFATLGCKLNQYDTTEVQALLEAEGFRTVPFETAAQVYVINTCTVTARADYSDRQAIRRAVARNPAPASIPGRKSSDRTAAKISASATNFPITKIGRGNGWVNRSCHSSRSPWALFTPASNAKSETK